MSARFLLSLTVALAMTIGGGVLHGKYSHRWSGRSELEAAGRRLESLPEQFGAWRLEQSFSLPADLLASLECRGAIHRRYQNLKTRQTVDLAMIVGPPGPTAEHIPEICYASRDYDLQGTRQRLRVDRSGRTPDEFWGVTFRSLQPGVGLRQVAYGWSQGTEWTAPDQPRFVLAESPVLYKLQLAVSLPASAEARRYDVCEEFLKDLLPVLDRVLRDPGAP